MPSQNELRTQITDQIVDALTTGGLPPWRQPWRADQNCGTPTNVVSKKNYSGINPLLLAIASPKAQAQSPAGGALSSSGASGCPGQSPPEHTSRRASGARKSCSAARSARPKRLPDGEEKDKTFFLLRSLHRLQPRPSSKGRPSIICVPGTPRSPPPTSYARHEQAEGSSVRLSPTFDTAATEPSTASRKTIIQMPEREKFISSETYYETLLHEMTHWCEHPSRLNWDRTKRKTATPSANSSPNSVRAT